MKRIKATENADSKANGDEEPALIKTHNEVSWQSWRLGGTTMKRASSVHNITCLMSASPEHGVEDCRISMDGQHRLHALHLHAFDATRPPTSLRRLLVHAIMPSYSSIFSPSVSSCQTSSSHRTHSATPAALSK